jgi:hypothetical protein
MLLGQKSCTYWCRPVGVVAVVEVLEHHLPVPRHVGERERARAHGVLEVVVVEVRLVVGQCGRERLGVGVDVHEHEAVPQLDLQRREREVLLVEALGALHRRCAEQATVEPVDPVVVRALERGAVALALAHRHRPVLAHRREAVDATLLVAHHDQRFAGDRDGEPIARLRDARRPPDAEPLVREERLVLEAQELVARVELGREGGRPGHVRDGGVERREEIVVQDAHRVAPVSVGPGSP